MSNATGRDGNGVAREKSSGLSLQNDTVAAGVRTSVGQDAHDDSEDIVRPVGPNRVVKEGDGRIISVGRLQVYNRCFRWLNDEWKVKRENDSDARQHHAGTDALKSRQDVLLPLDWATSLVIPAIGKTPGQIIVIVCLEEPLGSNRWRLFNRDGP